MGGKSTSTSATKLNQISVQSSSLGLPITVGWGRSRINCNLLWYGAFTAIPHTTKQSGGKGLGGGVTSTSYTYTASIILGLCEGGATGITGVRTVYRDKSSTTLSGAGLSLAVGTPTQATWGYLTTKFPAAAINYSGIAYCYAQDYALNDSATLPNHSFEVDFGIQLAVSAGGDADPKDIVTDTLTSAAYGVPGWPSGMIGNLSDWSLYCQANNLLLSPVLDSQRSGQDFFAEIATATNSEFVWSEGVLKVASYGDAVATGNTVTWTPNLTPAYDLTEDDLIPVDGKPVKLNIVDQSQAFNIVQVEFLDRANQYNVGIQTAQDGADIFQNGKRKQDPTTIHSICDSSIAQHACQLLLQRSLYMREEYTFRLPDNFALLEPMIDTVTLTTTTDELKLSRKQVRITQIVENADGTFDITAKGMNIGTASAALYNSHSGSGYVPNLDIAPGSVSTPVLINAPTSLTDGAAEVWIAAASTNPNWGGCEVWVSADDIQYHRVGSITAAARLGFSTATLASHADPDTTNTLSVDLTSSNGALSSSNAANANIGSTLCLIGTEIVSYQTATLTSAYHYGLTNLRRGLYGTTIASHASGQTFARLDDALFKYDYGSLALGSTIYVKLPSFNIYGRAIEDISTVLAYTVQLSPNVTIGSGSLQSFTLVNRENCFIDGRTVTKITGSNAWGDASVVSSESFIGGCMCGFQPLQATAGFMIGLNTDPATDDNYTSIDFAWYVDGTGVCQANHNGSGIGSTASYVAGDVFQIIYQGSTVTWLHNGATITTLTVASGLQLWLDSSFYTVGGKATNVTFAGTGAGSDGYSTNVVTLWQRSATAPATPTNDVTYTFATQAMSPSPNNSWLTAPPAANGLQLWATQQAAYANTPTVVLPHASWTTAVQSNADGLTSAVVTLYQRSASTPSVPSGTLTYTFATGIISGATLGSWTQSDPGGTNPCYKIQALASATAGSATDSILTTEWSVPAVYSQNGAAGLGTTSLSTVGGVTFDGVTIDSPIDGGGAWNNEGAWANQTVAGGASVGFQVPLVYGTSTDFFLGLRSAPSSTFSYTSFDLGAFRFADYNTGLASGDHYEIWGGASYLGVTGTRQNGYTYQVRYDATSGISKFVQIDTGGTATTLASFTPGAGKGAGIAFTSGKKGRATNLAFGAAGSDGAAGGSTATQLQQLSVTSVNGGTTTVYMYSNFFQVAAGATTPITWDGQLSYNSGAGSTNGQNTIEWSTNSWSTFTQIGSASSAVSIDSSGGSGADLTVNTSFTNSTGSAVRVQFRVKLTRSNANVSFNETGYLGVG